MQGKIFTLRNKIAITLLISIIPFVCITVYLLLSMKSYTRAYDTIVSNMTTANSYNLNFKEEMDESIYRMVARDMTAEEVSLEEEVRNPYDVIQELRKDFENLMEITNDSESLSWLDQLLHNVDILEERLEDVSQNINYGGKYDANIEMLENNIYILTELIQDDIQNYIYYQTKGIESLKAQLNEQVYQFIYYYSIILILIVTLTVFFGLLISSGIIKPIKELCTVTEYIAKGDFSARAVVNTKDEISDLSDSINDMTEHLEMLVDTIKEDERRMRHTELRLLQEQINPHFLYNTLDTIVWLIESDKSNEAEDMVVSLSSFFRLVLSHGQEFITIADEERHILSYLQIQQVRYKDILDYSIDIDKEIYPYEILKLTLQPLVENALYHGIKYKRAKGTIKVKGYLENEDIILIVSDDGVGMSKEDLDSLNSEIKKPCEETEKGFGLANVNERIRMNFGQEYGMTIESEELKGTTVTIRIPARVKGENIG